MVDLSTLPALLQEWHVPGRGLLFKTIRVDPLRLRQVCGVGVVSMTLYESAVEIITKARCVALRPRKFLDIIKDFLAHKDLAYCYAEAAEPVPACAKL